MQLEKTIKKVLLIDDDRQQFLLIGYLLSEFHDHDYRLIWCQDFEKGLQHIESNDCDVVLLDYHWIVSGADFIQRAGLLNRHVPIIVMTDGIEKEVDRKAISEGASDYLVKDDITADSLERTIRYSIERKNIDRHLDHLAHYDSLTSIPNRVLFQDRLNQAVSLGHRSKNPFTLMYIDLNDFKDINDNYGHNIGDQLLQQFAERLQLVVRSSDTVARIGGDEFTVLLNNLGSTPQIIQLTQKLLDSIAEPFLLEEHSLTVGCSVGLAVFPEAGDTAEQLQKNADIAMYQSKKTGSSCYRFFSRHKTENAIIENVNTDDLKNNINNGRLSICFSPRLNIKTGKIEALNVVPVWDHQDLGLQYYDDFCSSINNKQSVQFLTEWMFLETLPYLSQLNKEYGVSFSYSIRRSQLQSSSFSVFFREKIRIFNVNPKHIELSFLPKKNSDEMLFLKECLENMYDLGTNISVFDFGFNMLSIADIVNYDVSYLIFPHISKSAIERSGYAVVRDASINLAHQINKKIVVNHIENECQLHEASLLGCDYAEGGIVGTYLVYDELVDLLTNNDRDVVL